MTPKEFIEAWKGPLVRLPSDAPRPPQIADFLVHPGLPLELWYGSASEPFYLSFSGIVRPLTRVGDEHPDWPSECADELVLGTATKGDAQPWWCLHTPTGRVDSVDIEESTIVRLVNSSVAHLAASLLSFRRWVEGRTSDFNQLRSALEQADPAAWGKNEWAEVVDYWEQECKQHLQAEEEELKLICEID